MKQKILVLLISNSLNLENIIKQETEKDFNIEIIRIKNQDEYIEALNNKKPNIIILDYHDQCFENLKSFDILKEKRSDIVFIVVSDRMSEYDIVRLMKKGINNYICKKDFNLINKIFKEELAEYRDKKIQRLRFDELLFNEIKLSRILKICELEKEDIDVILSFALEQSLIITDSKFGYIYDYDKDKEELVLNRWSKKVTTQCKIQNCTERVIKLKNSDFFKQAIISKKPIIINDFYNIIREKTYPQVHIEINKFLLIPIIFDEEIISFIGLANKEEDYTESDIKEVVFFMDYVYKIISKKKIKKILLENQKYYEAIVNDIPALVCRFLPDGTLTFVNNTYCEYFEKTKDELIGRSFTLSIPDEDKQYVIEQFSSLNYNKPMVSYNHRVILKNGAIRWINWIDHAIFDENNNIIEYQSIGRDITEEIEKNRKLQTLLNEKELLLKEIHHRVKNNLQVISSLIELNLPYINEKNFIDTLQDVKNRTKAMASIYEYIYQSENFTKIDLSEYLKTLIERTIYNYDFKKTLAKKIELEQIFVSLDIATPIALITSELVSNAFKHAFSDKEEPYLEIKLKKIEENRYSLTINDNGIGIPENIDAYSDKTFGFMLVNLLVKQLNGEIKVKVENGTEITILFSDNLYNKKKMLDIK